MSQSKLFYLDLETGGVDKMKNPILQIAGAVEVDGEIKEYFDWHTLPFKEQEIDPEALAVTGIKVEDIAGYRDPYEVLGEIKRILDKYVSFWDKTDKFHVVGYNSRFDEDFFRQFFRNCSETQKDYQYGNGYGSYFWTPSIDVMQIAARKLMEKRGELLLPNFKLKTVCEAFGIGEDTIWHDALADIKATIKLYKMLEKNDG